MQGALRVLGLAGELPYISDLHSGQLQDLGLQGALDPVLSCPAQPGRGVAVDITDQTQVFALSDYKR